MDWVKDAGLCVNNLDATIVAEQPKLAPFVPEMKERLAAALGSNHVNIKATTTEGMGFCGRQEGIAAYAVISLTGE
jgi:2-C-methyl-D-erythritol 2,4-cyclodiphosphate synthase